MTAKHATMLSLALLFAAAGLAAQTTEPADESGDDGAATEGGTPPLCTVTLFDYEVGWVDDPAEQKRIADMMATVVRDMLSMSDHVMVVERVELTKVLDEQKLTLSGLTDKKKVEIGKLFGAQFLLWGRGFMLGDQVYITTKVVNAETAQFKSIIVRLPADKSEAEIIRAVSQRLLADLPKTTARLAPKDAPEIGPVEMLRRRLDGPPMTWLVAAHEEHLRSRPIVDPAIRNELEHLLAGAGQTVRSLDKGQARAAVDGEKPIRTFDPERKADRYVIAEGFSEFATRLSEDLVVCVARVEMKLIDARSGNVLAAGSREARATDLAENLAAKRALRKATRGLLLELAAGAASPPSSAGGRPE